MHDAMIASIIGAVVFGLFFVGGLYQAIHTMTHCTERILAHCYKTEKHFETHTTSHNGHSHRTTSVRYQAHVTYTYNGTEYQSIYPETFANEVECLECDLPLWINPNKPEENTTPMKPSDWVGVVILGLFVVLLIGVAVYTSKQ